MNNLLIYGPPASGKSFIGKKLADMFKIQFIDLDEEIERRTGDSIGKIIEILGEKGFRNVEADIFEDVVFTNSNAVVSLGGGTLLRESSRKIAEVENHVLCLEWDQKDLEANFLRDEKKRPLCQRGIEEYRTLLKDRKNHYKSFTHQLTNAFLDPDPNLENGLSNIFIGKLHSGILVNLIPILFPKSKISVVFDRNVEKEAEKFTSSLKEKNVLGAEVELSVSEKMKSLKTVGRILEKFDEVGMTRKDIVVSIGGGITSDITGFAASMWKRGVQWINIPTTLLSMVDASVGGKTGVNFSKAKNIIGAFHKPSCVFIDYQFLLTLKKSELVEGYAEAYKHYLLDENLKKTFDSSESTVVEALLRLGGMPAFNDFAEWKLVSKFLNPKVKVVKNDPFEKCGERAKLNLGHTVAHALEAVSKYKISHGQAVAIGICEELRIAEENGILEDKSLLKRACRDLASLGLQTELPKGIARSDLLRYMKKDKKNDGRGIKFILLKRQCETVEWSL